MFYKLIQEIDNKKIRIAAFEDLDDAELAKRDREVTGVEGLKIIPTGFVSRTTLIKKGEYQERASFWRAQGELMGSTVNLS